MSDYDLQSLKLPRLTGLALKAFAAALDTAPARALLLGSLAKNGGLPRLRQLNLEEPPTFTPLVPPDGRGSAEDSPQGDEPEPAPGPALPFAAIADYAAAYRREDLSPLDVAERFLQALDRSEQDSPPLRAFIACSREDVLAQARASTGRFRQGRPLSLLDGVPVAVKDEIDLLPYPTTVGTAFLGTAPARQDATVTARLRAAGALLVGKTNMHELGIAPNGGSANYEAVRNPHDPRCDTGGSSSGSAAAVAAGLCPAALGADGGGSIRVPAALCGVVGLKPTYGRVSEFGAAPLCWSIAHLGPLAGSVEDAALIYSLIAGPDEQDPHTLRQPSPALNGWRTPHLEGVRLGIYPEWFEHAGPQLVQAGRAAVREFEKLGAQVVEVSIPELDAMRVAHVVLILSEMAAAMHPHRRQCGQHSPSTRISLALGRSFTSVDYVQAQRMRTRAMAIFANVFRQVDAVITPATALPAQPLPPGGESGGWSDLGVDVEYMRFVFPANLTGLPAIAFPAGYSPGGLPLGLQAMARHWDENLLLRLAGCAEQFVERRRPTRFYPLLD